MVSSVRVKAVSRLNHNFKYCSVPYYYIMLQKDMEADFMDKMSKVQICGRFVL